MFMKLFFLLLFFGSGFLMSAQNLVLNPSFEEGLPDKIIKKRNEKVQSGQVILPSWISPTSASPDVFNSPSSSCNGIPVAHARSGKGMAGLVLAERKSLSSFFNGAYKEYLTGTLQSPLEKGKTYEVEFYFTLDRTSAFVADSIGAFLSKEIPLANQKTGMTLPAQIFFSHDSLVLSKHGWVRVRGRFVAEGGERFITIGSFGTNFLRPLSQWQLKPLSEKGDEHPNAYYYIDDVSLKEVKNEASDLADKAVLLHLLIDVDTGKDSLFLKNSPEVWLQKMKTMLPDYAFMDVFVNTGEGNKIFGPLPFSEWKDLNLTDALLEKPGNLNDAMVTLIRYVKTIQDKEQHIILLSPHQPNLSSRVREALKLLGEKSISFNVLQWKGKANKNLLSVTKFSKGIYSRDADGLNESLFRETLYQVANFRNRVYYSTSRKMPLFMWFTLPVLVAGGAVIFYQGGKS